jgi:NitT/TauT family transport system permease protein
MKKLIFSIDSILMDAITPNKQVGSIAKNSIVGFWLGATLLLWIFSGSRLLPSPLDILTALKMMITEKNFIGELLISITFCMKAMGYAIVFAFITAYLSVLPIFRPICAFVAKARFLSTAGLTFFVGEITPDSGVKKLVMLSFVISVFLVTSMLAVIMEVKKDDLDYARTLRMNEWKSVWEVIIKGKLDMMFEVIRQNFAIAWMMLAMAESLCRAEGGVGILLTDTDKHFHLDEVFAIQVVILCVGIFFDYMLKNMRAWFFPYSVLKLERK